MRFIRLACYCLWTLHIACSLNFVPKTRFIQNQRTKRNTQTKLSVLIDLYKMNPLRDSKAFGMFSNKIFLPHRANQGTGAMHFDENESIREKLMRTDVNLKRIQDAIHALPLPNRGMEPPEYNVNSIVPETFSDELTINDLYKFNLLEPEQEDAFKDIFGHILESNERTNAIPVTDRFVNALGPTSVSVSHRTDFVNLENNNIVKYSDDEVIVLR